MNHSILGIDLATRRTSDIGIAYLHSTDQAVDCQFLRPASTFLTDPPQVEALADYVCQVAADASVSVIAMDGPQGWKSAENGLEHQRVAEKALHTQAKTGLPDNCKPSTSLRFVRFSIEFFAALEERGWQRQLTADASATHSKPAQRIIEVFPTAAWRALGCKALPAKPKSSQGTVTAWLTMLRAHFPLNLTETPTHDELQAVVAGLVGLAFARDNDYRSFGIAPFLLENEWREGYIVNFQQE